MPITAIVIDSLIPIVLFNLPLKLANTQKRKTVTKYHDFNLKYKNMLIKRRVI